MQGATLAHEQKGTVPFFVASCHKNWDSPPIAVSLIRPFLPEITYFPAGTDSRDSPGCPAKKINLVKLTAPI